MSRRLMNGSRLATGALALVVAVASSATCLAGALGMPRAESHACCAAMADDCGSVDTVDGDCCIVTQAALSAIAPFTPAAPAPALAGTGVVWLSAPGPAVALEPDVSHPVSPPAYLLDSVFRI